MNDIYVAVGALIPTLAAFFRLTWWMATIQTKLTQIETILASHSKDLEKITGAGHG